MQQLQALIRAVPDFPTAGITFRDITPLLVDAQAFARCIDLLAEPWVDQRIEAICAIESRGFIFGAALAIKLGVGFVPLRKPGKLPPPIVAIDYALEYGHDRLEVRDDACRPGERVLLVDDVLATGGTLAAARALIGKVGAQVVGASVVIELTDLPGRELWGDAVPLRALLSY
jgi:adenine phosphoribosyltransferase